MFANFCCLVRLIQICTLHIKFCLLLNGLKKNLDVRQNCPISYLFWTHVHLGSNLVRMPQGPDLWPQPFLWGCLAVFFLCGDEAKVSNFDRSIHGEEYVGGLKD